MAISVGHSVLMDRQLFLDTAMCLPYLQKIISEHKYCLSGKKEKHPRRSAPHPVGSYYWSSFLVVRFQAKDTEEYHRARKKYMVYQYELDRYNAGV